MRGSVEQNIDPTQVEDQIVSNLLSASILLDDEVARYRTLLEKLTFRELLKVLIVSHELREQCTTLPQQVVIGIISMN